MTARGTNIPERVSSLEASMESLSREVRETNDNIMRVADTMESGFQNIHNLLVEQRNKIAEERDKTNEEFRAQGKTNWPLLLSCFGVLVTISGWWSIYSTMDMRLDIAVIKHHLKIEEANRKSEESHILELLD